MRRTLDEIKAAFDGPALSEADLKRLLRDPRVGVRELAKKERRRRQAEDEERQRLETLLTFERELWGQGVLHVCGIDEVGMGPLAGPVVAAAVILPAGTSIPRIDDSKRLDEPTRVELDRIIRERAVAFAIASCSVEEIDSINILRASIEAMRRAVAALSVAPQHLLIDARRLALDLPQTPIIGGDAKSQSIAAASIIAKVFRDRLMDELGQQYPGYGFERHKGYSTPEHFAALKRLGRTPIHRRSFSPVQEASEPPRQASLFG